jgi:hypothetical protein
VDVGVTVQTGTSSWAARRRGWPRGGGGHRRHAPPQPGSIERGAPCAWTSWTVAGAPMPSSLAHEAGRARRAHVPRPSACSTASRRRRPRQGWSPLAAALRGAQAATWTSRSWTARRAVGGGRPGAEVGGQDPRFIAVAAPPRSALDPPGPAALRAGRPAVLARYGGRESAACCSTISAPSCPRFCEPALLEALDRASPMTRTTAGSPPCCLVLLLAPEPGTSSAPGDRPRGAWGRYRPSPPNTGAPYPGGLIVGHGLRCGPHPIRAIPFA